MCEHSTDTSAWFGFETAFGLIFAPLSLTFMTCFGKIQFHLESDFHPLYLSEVHLFILPDESYIPPAPPVMLYFHFLYKSNSRILFYKCSVFILFSVEMNCRGVLDCALC